MRLTNSLGLPDAIVRAVQNDPYSKGNADISATGLIAPARMVELMRRHGDELTEDVADRLWSLYGQIVHGVLERAETESAVEERLFMERHGWIISGKFDRYVLIDELLQDYKMTSTYSIADGPKPEWIAQASIYRLLLEEDGRTVSRAESIVMLRDWSEGRARNSLDYPQTSIVKVPVPLWDTPTTEQYIRDRLLLHSRADVELPECTPEERWERGGSVAVMKPGGKRAVKICDTKDEAIAYVRSTGDRTLLLEERHPENIRCQRYCPAAPVCAQTSARAGSRRPLTSLTMLAPAATAARATAAW